MFEYERQSHQYIKLSSILLLYGFVISSSMIKEPNKKKNYLLQKEFKLAENKFFFLQKCDFN